MEEEDKIHYFGKNSLNYLWECIKSLLMCSIAGVGKPGIVAIKEESNLLIDKEGYIDCKIATPTTPGINRVVGDELVQEEGFFQVNITKVKSISTSKQNNKFYVCGINGNDSTGNGSEQKPYATLQKAVDSCPAYSFRNMIYILSSGDYDCVNISNISTAGGEISFYPQPYDSVDVVINGINKIYNSGRVDFNYITFKNMVMSGIGTTNSVYSSKVSYNYCTFLQDKNSATYSAAIEILDGSSINISGTTKFDCINGIWLSGKAPNSLNIVATLTGNCKKIGINSANISIINITDFPQLVCGEKKLTGSVVIPAYINK